MVKMNESKDEYQDLEKPEESSIAKQHIKESSSDEYSNIDSNIRREIDRRSDDATPQIPDIHEKNKKKQKNIKNPTSPLPINISSALRGTFIIVKDGEEDRVIRLVEELLEDKREIENSQNLNPDALYHLLPTETECDDMKEASRMVFESASRHYHNKPVDDLSAKDILNIKKVSLFGEKYYEEDFNYTDDLYSKIESALGQVEVDENLLHSIKKDRPDEISIEEAWRRVDSLEGIHNSITELDDEYKERIGKEYLHTIIDSISK
jgi:hypothetical protein